MPLAAGTRLGPYEIQSAIGAGGMGEVYKARDTRLDRVVAIKVLPAALASDPQFRERFDREARAISQLEHPHICALYDVGEQDGTAYLVMQYLEGETLACRLTRGAMPLHDALTTAGQIADALDRAHRAGIVHRDLKPGNVMLMKAGAGSAGTPQAKLLDFGLAKHGPAIAGGSIPPQADLTSVPTMTSPLTAQGSIVGTFQYMAPEQIEGREADHRSDIFAFGCVLYEMLTGHKAFTGETRAGLISAILKDQPPPIVVAQPAAPAALEHVVRTCLAKDPEHRWQHAADVARQLTWIAETSSTMAAADPDRRSMRRERIILATAAVMAIAAGTLGWTAWRRAGRVDATSSRPMHLTLTLEKSQPISRIDVIATNDPHPSIALSPDGTRLAYAADLGGVARLVVRDLSTSGATPIAGTEGAVEPFFSPDGQWVGFAADGKLKKVALGGGAPVAITDAPHLRGAHWYASDSIVFVPDLYAAVWRVSASGGTPEQVTTVDATHGERTHRWPEMLPGGRAMLFTIGTGGSFDDARIVVQSLDTGQRRTLVESGSNPRYVPTGHVVYARAGMLTAVPFDTSPSRLHVTGPPVKLMDGVMTEGSGAAQFAFSASGLFTSMPTVPDAEAALVWVDRAGKVTRLPGAPGAFGRIALAPDGHRVAIGTKLMDVRIRDLSRGTEWALGTGTRAINFAWTPEGSRMVFGSEKSGAWNLVSKRADGEGEEEPLLPPGAPRYEFDVSWDGKWLAYGEQTTTGENAPWILSLRDRKASPLVRNRGDERFPAFSPDGRYLATAVSDAGRSQVFVRTLPSGDQRWQVSTMGGMEPHWSPDGRELFYRFGDQMMAVSIAARGGTVDIGTPRALFQGRFIQIGGRSYSVSPDGNRFLMLQPTGDATPPVRLDVITNWFGEVARATARK